jgi:hypothetical protein
VATQGNDGVNELRAIVADEQDTPLPVDAAPNSASGGVVERT